MSAPLASGVIGPIIDTRVPADSVVMVVLFVVDGLERMRTVVVVTPLVGFPPPPLALTLHVGASAVIDVIESVTVNSQFQFPVSLVTQETVLPCPLIQWPLGRVMKYEYVTDPVAL